MHNCTCAMWRLDKKKRETIYMNDYNYILKFLNDKSFKIFLSFIHCWPET